MVTSWPSELTRELLHEDTAKIYAMLIANKIPLRIHRIDHLGIPFGEFTENPEGVETWHSLALNHGEIQLVKAVAP